MKGTVMLWITFRSNACSKYEQCSIYEQLKDELELKLMVMGTKCILINGFISKNR